MKVPVEHARGVDLNLASEEELSSEVGLGPERAQRIVESRPLRTWDDLEAIEGFTERLVRELQGGGATLGDPTQADVRARSVRLAVTRMRIGNRRDRIGSQSLGVEHAARSTPEQSVIHRPLLTAPPAPPSL